MTNYHIVWGGKQWGKTQWLIDNVPKDVTVLTMYKNRKRFQDAGFTKITHHLDNLRGLTDVAVDDVDGYYDFYTHWHGLYGEVWGTLTPPQMGLSLEHPLVQFAKRGIKLPKRGLHESKWYIAYDNIP